MDEEGSGPSTLPDIVNGLTGAESDGLDYGRTSTRKEWLSQSVCGEGLQHAQEEFIRKIRPDLNT